MDWMKISLKLQDPGGWMVLEGRPFGTRLCLNEVMMGSVSLADEKETFALHAT